jgi:transcription elongation factor Elf1
MNLKTRDRNRIKNRTNHSSATLVCKNCNKMFTINIGEICWHYEVGNLIPQFCSDCRENRKQKRLEKRKTRKFQANIEDVEEENLIAEI